MFRPSRHVVSALVPSSKSRRSLFCADLHTEQTLVEMLNFDPEVRIICDSLPLLTSLPVNNEFLKVQPSFVVFRGDRVVVYLCQKIAELGRFNRRHPGFFERDSEGTWTVPLLVAQLRLLNIDCKLFTEQSVNPILVRNLRYLRRYRQADADAFSPDQVAAVQSALAVNRSFTLQQLDDELGAGSPDLVNYCLATGFIFADLERTLVVERDRSIAYSSMAEVHTARRLYALAHQAPNPLPAAKALFLTPGARFTLDGVPYFILEKSSSQLFIENTQDCSRRTLSLSALCDYARENRVEATAEPTADASKPVAVSELSPRSQEMVASKMRAIQDHVNYRCQRGRRPHRPLGRTERRWLSDYMKAHLAGQPGVSGLYPRTALRGSNEPRLPESVRTLVISCIEELYEKTVEPTIRYVASEIRLRARSAGLNPPALETVRRYVNARFGWKQVAARRGRKVAQAFKRANLADTEMVFVPQWPLGLTAADSSQVDVQLRREIGPGVTGQRVWLTVLIDVYSGRVLAIWLTVGRPNGRCLGETFRITFQRFGRLPEAVLVDNGSEFHNDETKDMVQSLGVEYRLRAPGNPCSGHAVERFFGAMTAEFLDNLPGNVKAVKRGDEIEADNNPERFAAFTLSSFRKILEQYCYEVRDTMPTARSGKSPRQIYEEGSVQHGLRFLGVITTPKALERALMEPTRRGTLTFRGGFRIGGYSYDSSELSSGLEGKCFPVTRCSRDVRTAYAFVDHRWVTLRCRVLEQEFAGLHEDRIWALSQELRVGKDLGDPNGEKREAILGNFEAEVRALIPALRVERARQEEAARKAAAEAAAKAAMPAAEPAATAQAKPTQTVWGCLLGVEEPKRKRRTPKAPSCDEEHRDEVSPGTFC